MPYFFLSHQEMRFYKKIFGKSELKTKLSGLFRNKIFTKYATKFEKKFHLHFDGEILIKEKGQEEILELFGAHNHDLIGTKIQIELLENRQE